MKNGILFFLSLISFQLRSQISDINKDAIIERTIEFIGEANENADIDYTSFIEDYYLMLDNPLNINQATFSDLAQLNFLSDIQILAIVDYRSRYRRVLSIFELDAIPELDKRTIEILLPFVFVGDLEKRKENWKNVFTYGRHDVILRYQRVLESKAGYQSFPDSILELNPNKVYQGNPDRYYLRYRYQYKNKLSYGITAEKDPGETFFRADNSQGFDFYSAHFMLQDIGKFKKIIVGDFHANFGQGLNIWTGFNIGRTIQTLKVKQSGRGLRPYTSANESQFFRGAGITFDFNRFESTVFGSYKMLDARTSLIDTNDAQTIIDNFQLTGFHRTISEIENKNQVSQMVFGSATSFQTNNLKVNFTALYSKFGGDFQNNTALYNQFDFSGDSQMSFGIDYQYITPRVSFFGELSTGLNGKVNSINGLLWRVDPKFDLVAVHRFFYKENQNLFGNNFARSNQNGQGVYFGVEARLTSKIKASAFYDQSKSDWFRYLIDGPSAERLFLGQIDYSFNRYSNMYIRIRSRLKPRNISGTNEAITQQDYQKTNSIRLHYSQKINSQISVKSRVEILRYEFNGEKSNGLVMYQDIIYSIEKYPVKLYGRYAIFDTDDYNSRIYTFENDLLYVFSVPGLFNQGFRTYVMAKYEVGKRIDLWLRWSRTTYTNQKTISSGLEEIEGNFKSDIKAQLKIRF